MSVFRGNLRVKNQNCRTIEQVLCNTQPRIFFWLRPCVLELRPKPNGESRIATTLFIIIFMPHSSPNSLLVPTTPGSHHTSKHLKPFAGTSSMFTSAPSTPHL